jgi:hypothetical protein
MYVNDDSDNWVEIGWFADGASGNVIKCDVSTDPHVLVFVAVDGSYKCKPGTPALNAGVWSSYQVENPEHDDDFDYYWESEYEGYYTTAFAQGPVDSFSERHNGSDSLVADFNNLKYEGAAGGWNAWDSTSTSEYVGGTTGWAFCFDANDAYHVRASGNC